MDAFYSKCLPKVLGIAPSYYSRISNQSVLQTACRQRLNSLLLETQMLLMTNISRLPSSSMVRRAVFEPGSTALRKPIHKRKRGRPCATWNSEVYKHCVAAAGSTHGFQDAWREAHYWKLQVKEYCRNCFTMVECHDPTTIPCQRA